MQTDRMRATTLGCAAKSAAFRRGSSTVRKRKRTVQSLSACRQNSLLILPRLRKITTTAARSIFSASARPVV